MIRTARLTLRRFRESDAESLAAYCSDPAVARYQSWEPPVTVAQATLSVRSLGGRDPGQPGWFQFAVERTAEGDHIGDVGVDLHANLMQAQIGFTFAAAHHGQGYASEAVRGVLGHLFSERGLHRVAADCDVRNTASARLLERVGFAREGMRRQHVFCKGEWTDEFLWGMLAEDWQRLGNGAAGAGARD